VVSDKEMINYVKLYIDAHCTETNDEIDTINQNKEMINALKF